MNKTPMRTRREALGLTIADVARRTGRPHSTIRALDVGLGLGFNLEMKKAVADALGADILDLFPELVRVLDYVSGRGYVVEKTAAKRRRK